MTQEKSMTKLKSEAKHEKVAGLTEDLEPKKDVGKKGVVASSTVTKSPASVRKTVDEKGPGTKILGKVAFERNVYYEVPYPAGFNLNVKEGSSIKAGALIYAPENKSREENVQFSGKTKFEPGQKINKDDVISVVGRFRKTTYRSNLTGIVQEVRESEMLVFVQEGDDDVEFDPVKAKSPFDATVEKILPDRVILTFSAVVINLVASKGMSAIGKLKYLKASEFADKKNLPRDLDGTIVVTDFLSQQISPVISGLGADGILATSVNYTFYRDMVVLVVPIGIISGYGQLKEDEAILSYIKKKQDSTVWLDSDYHRLIIPEEKEPTSLKNYEFDLRKAAIL